MDFGEMSLGDLNARMNHLNVTLIHFWRGEYLLQLREYHSHDKRRKGNKQPFNGKEVLLQVKRVLETSQSAENIQ